MTSAATLAPGTLLNDRYAIKKLVAQKTGSCIYLARDQAVTERNWVVKELDPGDCPPEELEARRAAFQDTLVALKQFDHPRLAKVLDHFTEHGREYVVLEHVEGVSLKTLVDMAAAPGRIPEAQILGWMLQMCDALRYLHDRPHPFILDNLDPTHVMINTDETLKLVNFGLDRFFDPEVPLAQLKSAAPDQAAEIRCLGGTVYYLFTMQPLPEALPDSIPGMSAALHTVMRRCAGSDAGAAFGFTDDLAAAFDGVLHPKDLTRKPIVMPSVTIDVGKYFRGFVEAVMGQPSVALVAETLLLLALIGWWAYAAAPKRVYLGDQPRIYFVCGNELWAVSQEPVPRVLDRRALPYAVTGLAADSKAGNRGILYVADSDGQKVMMLDLPTHEPINIVDPAIKRPGIPDLPGSTKLYLAPDRNNLFVLHPAQGNVEHISVLRNVVTGLIPTGPGPAAVAAVPGSHRLAISNAQGKSVTIANPFRQQVITVVPLDGKPAGVAWAAASQHLFVAIPLAGEVIDIDCSVLPDEQPNAPAPAPTPIGAATESAATPTPIGEAAAGETSPAPSASPQEGPPGWTGGEAAVITCPTYALTSTGGLSPTALALSSDEKFLYVGNAGSGSVGVIDLENKTLVATIRVGGSPVEMAWARKPNGDLTDQLWVLCRGTNTLVLIDADLNSSRIMMTVGRDPAHLTLMP